MSIKIHHGPNGSFKTSGAIQDDAIPAIKQGRVIITNVRGFTIDSVLEQFPDAPDSLQVMNIDTDTTAGLEAARTWFQWVPKGAFMIWDEAQKLFPKAWTERDLVRFQFEGGPDAASAADRPADWLDAWTRHRHWNWDVILTTPNIRYLRDDIRFTSEMAYKHFNKAAILGWLGRGKYKETPHDAQDNKPGEDALQSHKRIEKRTFALYLSTATGTVTDTIAGYNLFMHPKILGLGGIAALGIGYPLFTNGSLVPQLASDTAAVVAPAAAVVAPQASAEPAPRVRRDSAADAGAAAVAALGDDPYAGKSISIRATLRSDKKGTVYLFDVSADGQTFLQTSRDIVEAGYKIRQRGLCAADLVFDKTVRTVTCAGRVAARGEERLGSERRAASGGSASLNTGSSATVDGVPATRVTVVPSGKPGHLW
ncbi:Zona occludens toxin [compost metagenome]